MAKKKKNEETKFVSKTIDYTEDDSIRIKEEVLYQKKNGNTIDEKTLCPILLREALTVREKKRSKKPTL